MGEIAYEKRKDLNFGNKFLDGELLGKRNLHDSAGA